MDDCSACGGSGLVEVSYTTGGCIQTGDGRKLINCPYCHAKPDIVKFINFNKLIMEIELIYVEDFDGNWFKILKDGITITAYKARDRWDIEALNKAEASFDALVLRAQKKPAKELVKSVTI